MAQELDLKNLPAVAAGAAKDALSIGIGAAWKSIDAVMRPNESIPALVDTAFQMVLPAGTAGGIEEKAKALAGVWVDKGITLVNDCKAAGEKFTEGK